MRDRRCRCQTPEMQTGSLEDTAHADHVDHQQNQAAHSPQPHEHETRNLSIDPVKAVNDEAHFGNGTLEIRDLQSENNGNDVPPNKKRKVADSTTSAAKASGPRNISPPWKKIEVEGPSSFVEEGKRKSARTNFVPIDLQPLADKRQTRATNQHASRFTKSRYGGAFKSSPLTSSASTQTQSSVKRTHSISKSTANTNTNTRSPSKNTQPTSETPPPPPKRSHKKKIRPVSPTTVQPPTENPHQTRRIHRRRISNATTDPGSDHAPTTNGWHREGEKSQENEIEGDAVSSPNRRPQRISLKVRMPTVNIQHPGNMLQDRRYDTFQEWFDKEGRQGLAPDDTDRSLTDREAVREAQLRKRIVDAANPGGLLSEERCQFYRPNAFEPPDREYTHQDRLVAHAIRFRYLMDMERRKHKRNAKEWAEKVAASVKEKQDKAYMDWKQAQPKTDEDLAQEREDAAREVYQQIQDDIKQKWVMVTQLVEAHRMQRWQEEQDRLGKEALNEAIEKSKGFLDRRRTRGGSTMGSGDESSNALASDSGTSASGSDDESEHSSNMSSSNSESEEDHIVSDGDEDLTQEQLRLKYASVQGVEEETSKTIEQTVAETSSADIDNGGIHMQIDPPPAMGTEDSIYVNGVEADEGPQPPVTVEEVDDALMDNSDESTDMDDDDMSNSAQPSAEEDSIDGESEDDEGPPNLLGFFDRSERIEPSTGDTTGPDKPRREVEEEEYEDEAEEVSLIPDATQGPTPIATPETVSEELHAEAYGDKAFQSVGLALNTDDGNHDPAVDLMLEKPLDRQASPPANAKAIVEDISLPTTPVSTNPIKTPIPSLLRGTLREYQHFGLDWLAGLYAIGNNGILADEMGLGKTIQTIALLAHLAVEHEVWGPHLIVVPTSVILNWEIEFKKFLPGFKVLTYYGTQQERKEKRGGWTDDNKWNVWITSYNIVIKDHQIFKKRPWHYMILDEAHNIKNFQSQRWQTLLRFNTRARLLLTGTPLQNNLTELWSLLFFLMPPEQRNPDNPGFTNLENFTHWFRKPVEQILENGKETIDDEARGQISSLHDVMRPYLLRRLKADVEKQMPGKYEHVVYCKLSKRQRYLYDGFMSRAQTKETLASGNTFSIMNALMQLRKVCNHPDLFETRQIVTSFAMPKSAVADFEIKELLVRRRLLQEDPGTDVDLNMINLLPSANEQFSALDTIQRQRIGALGTLRQLCSQQWGRITHDMPYDGTTVNSALACYDNTARLSRHGRLSQAAYQTSLRSQRRPLYSQSRMRLLQLMFAHKNLPHPPMPGRKHLSDWYTRMSPALSEMVLTLPERSAALETAIVKFACVTPSVVATDMIPLTLCRKGVELVESAKQLSTSDDPFHEARMRLSIAFPDKRLLQYDCGKLQRLDTLLRTLQAGGHRALIFTQMTRVLDILEEFLNIHGHRYLRLDGSTKIEQRQVLTDRFNRDDRILAFILSSRSGGIGINLTGADTVIFYDLDWNPAMDKQCQDRSHRIGQTRDVHIYRLVSEYTIEANILRKANQKRLLDDVVIQEGEFTTDYFNNIGVKAVIEDGAFEEGNAEANAAMDRVLGGGGSRVFEAAEDPEDIAAARAAEKELAQNNDAAEFDEKAGASSTGPATPKTTDPPTPAGLMPPVKRLHGDVELTTTMEAAQSGLAVPGSTLPQGYQEVDQFPSCDDYMLRFLEWELKDVPIQPPVDNNKKPKKGKEHGHRKR